MQFQKSDYNVPPNGAAAQTQGPPHAGGKNSINFGHFPNAKEDNNKYETFGQRNPEKDHLAKQGKCLLSKTPGHMARDCATRKISYSYRQGNRKLIYEVKTASLSVESEADTSHLQVRRPPTDSRKAIILVRQTILNAVEITINGHKAHA